MRHCYQDLIKIFNQCFQEKNATLLVKGGDEPIYLPASKDQPYHRIFFAHGYFSSALHECAHWFIAGEERRKLEDYGYWYVPSHRTIEQQTFFQKVEIKPQAIEWILSIACDYKFQFSLDNLDNPQIDTAPFYQAITQQVMNYCKQGLPLQAEIFRRELCHFYGTSPHLNILLQENRVQNTLEKTSDVREEA